MKYFKIKKIIYISVLILVCGGIAFLMISKNKKQSFIFENESILKEETNYNIRIKRIKNILDYDSQNMDFLTQTKKYTHQNIQFPQIDQDFVQIQHNY